MNTKLDSRVSASDDRAQRWTRVWEPAPPAGPVTRTGVGPWDELTRGFWDGGSRLEAWELRPGDVYREGTLTGWRVTAVDRGHYGNATTILVTVDGWDTPRVLSPGQPLELLPAHPAGVGYAR